MVFTSGCLLVFPAFCRSMARDSDEDSDDDVLNVPCTADENDTSDVLQPFTRAASIVMNIKVRFLKPLSWSCGVNL